MSFSLYISLCILKYINDSLSCVRWEVMTVGLKVKVLWDVVTCWLVSGYLVTTCELTQRNIPEDISIQLEICLLYLMCCNMLWHRFFSHTKYGSKEHLNESKEVAFQCEVQLFMCSLCCFIPHWSWYWFIDDSVPPPSHESNHHLDTHDFTLILSGIKTCLI